LEKEQLKKKIHKEIVEVAMMAAGKLVSEKLDEDKDRQAIERFIKEVKTK
jgi:F0F1-type ATP synthase membrane subunit b/b'